MLRITYKDSIPKKRIDTIENLVWFFKMGIHFSESLFMFFNQGNITLSG